MTHATAPNPTVNTALIWLDAAHAVVARAAVGGTLITPVDRAADGDDAYLLRIVHEAADCDRLIVSGTDASRVAFEREYVAAYRRPDRLIDQGSELEPTSHELANRLRLLTPLPGQSR